jgi:hypothetical protein
VAFVLVLAVVVEIDLRGGFDCDYEDDDEDDGQPGLFNQPLKGFPARSRFNHSPYRLADSACAKVAGC